MTQAVLPKQPAMWLDSIVLQGGPGRVSQSVSAPSQYARVADFTSPRCPGQGTHTNQPMNASVSGTTN